MNKNNETLMINSDIFDSLGSALQYSLSVSLETKEAPAVKQDEKGERKRPEMAKRWRREEQRKGEVMEVKIRMLPTKILCWICMFCRWTQVYGCEPNTQKSFDRANSRLVRQRSDRERSMSRADKRRNTDNKRTVPPGWLMMIFHAIDFVSGKVTKEGRW